MFVGSKSFAELIEKIDFTKWQMDEATEIEKYLESTAHHYPYQLEKAFQKAVGGCDFDEMDRLMKEFSQYPSANLCRNNPLRSRKNNIICNCTLLTRMALESGVEDEKAYALSDMYINKVEEIDELDALNEFNMLMYYDYVYQIKRVVSSLHVYSELVKKAIGYIDAHLSDAVTLEALALEIGVNRSYLSRLFKKEVKVTFTEYLHKSRIEKAKELILFSGRPLAEIAGELGYSSQSHFNKSFKQYMGMSPSQLVEKF